MERHIIIIVGGIYNYPLNLNDLRGITGYDQRFIEAIYDMLEKAGKSVVAFYGATPPTERKNSINRFQAKDAQYFIGNQAVGGMGIKLSAADVAIYYSNTFSYEDRQQSWARPEEIGMKNAVLYIDLVLNTVIDHE